MRSLERAADRSEASEEVLQEVVRHARGEVGHFPQVLRSGLKHRKVDDAVRVDGQDRGDVAAPVAVVRRRPHSDEQLAEEVPGQG